MFIASALRMQESLTEASHLALALKFFYKKPLYKQPNTRQPKI